MEQNPNCQFTNSKLQINKTSKYILYFLTGTLVLVLVHTASSEYFQTHLALRLGETKQFPIFVQQFVTNLLIKDYYELFLVKSIFQNNECKPDFIHFSKQFSTAPLPYDSTT